MVDRVKRMNRVKKVKKVEWIEWRVQLRYVTQSISIPIQMLCMTNLCPISYSMGVGHTILNGGSSSGFVIQSISILHMTNRILHITKPILMEWDSLQRTPFRMENAPHDEPHSEWVFVIQSISIPMEMLRMTNPIMKNGVPTHSISTGRNACFCYGCCATSQGSPYDEPHSHRMGFLVTNPILFD